MFTQIKTFAREPTERSWDQVCSVGSRAKPINEMIIMGRNAPSSGTSCQLLHEGEGFYRHIP
jgi:hypothetical protein